MKATLNSKLLRNISMAYFTSLRPSVLTLVALFCWGFGGGFGFNPGLDEVAVLLPPRPWHLQRWGWAGGATQGSLGKGQGGAATNGVPTTLPKSQKGPIPPARWTPSWMARGGRRRRPPSDPVRTTMHDPTRDQHSSQLSSWIVWGCCNKDSTCHGQAEV